MKQINRVNRMAQAIQASQSQFQSAMKPIAPQVDKITQLFHTTLSQLDSPSRLLYGFILVLAIVYSSVIPSEYRTFADSLLGKLFGITAVFFATHSLGWVYGLLTALAFLLLLHGAPRKGGIEGFDGGGSVSEKKTVGKRWFVERVLNERPVAISTDQVKTQAITD
jgi:hypothetical protein